MSVCVCVGGRSLCHLVQYPDFVVYFILVSFNSLALSRICGRGGASGGGDDEWQRAARNFLRPAHQSQLLLPWQHVGGIKAASRVFSRGPSRLGGCAACRVTPRNQAAAAATNCCPPELLGQSKALTLNP